MVTWIHRAQGHATMTIYGAYLCRCISVLWPGEKLIVDNIITTKCQNMMRRCCAWIGRPKSEFFFLFKAGYGWSKDCVLSSYMYPRKSVRIDSKLRKHRRPSLLPISKHYRLTAWSYSEVWSAPASILLKFWIGKSEIGLGTSLKTAFSLLEKRIYSLCRRKVKFK